MTVWTVEIDLKHAYAESSTSLRVRISSWPSGATLPVIGVRE